MFAILILSAVVSGQCGPRGCPAPARFAPVPTAAPAPSYVMPAATARPYFVVRNYSVRHQGLDFVVRGYMNDAGRVVWNTGEYGNQASFDAAKARKSSTKAAVPAPAVKPERRPSAVAEAAPIRNFGMEPGRMKPTPSYTAPSDEARRFVAEARSDSGGATKMHVTVVGTDDERAPVVNDLLTNPAFSSLKDSILVQDYTRDEWPVDTSLGFVTTGKPTIIVQSGRSAADPKGGRVVYRASDYSMGPEALAEAIRKANPDYKPSIDPGPSTGKPSASACPLGFTRDHWPHILAVGMALVFLLVLPRKGA